MTEEMIAEQLALPHVPDFLKGRVRRLLVPVISRTTVPAVDGNCYRLAKQCVRLGGKHFRYFEGTWQPQFDPAGPDTDGPRPHAWFTVFGFIVDLFEEIMIAENGDEGWEHFGVIFCSRCRSQVAVPHGFRCRRCHNTAHRRRTPNVCIDCEKKPRAGGLTRCVECQKKRLARDLKRRQFDGAHDPLGKHYDSEKFLGQPDVKLGFVTDRPR